MIYIVEERNMYKMKAVILAGGKGTRISEESKVRPKPMVEIGGYPILWHIMKCYEKYNITEFIVCCGYKGHMIKEYFVNYNINRNNICIDMVNEKKIICESKTEPWKVTLIDTGEETLTAGRLLQVEKYLENETFMLTYGDGVADINLDELLEFHKREKKILTISTTRPEGRFGALKLNDKENTVEGFKEKAREDQSWVNIGFMVMEPEIFQYLGEGKSMLEAEPFERLAKERKMAAYRHNGFWSPMDNIHDRDYLQHLWESNLACWR